VSSHTNGYNSNEDKAKPIPDTNTLEHQNVLPSLLEFMKPILPDRNRIVTASHTLNLQQSSGLLNAFGNGGFEASKRMLKYTQA
jgi:hypothetical protein